MAKIAVLEKVKELLKAPSICPEMKKAAERYVAAVGTDREKEAGRALVAELKDDVQTIDEVSDFFASEDARKLFGAEQAAALSAQAAKVKAAGGKYCFCPACTAGAALLAMEKDI
ncbi:MAG: heat-shock protein Hsp90 [Succiniclasticum sp.]|jgi:hypothetical protein|nr:heat-shock protein Hsp90 [Succiniclasticum sp.]MEE3478430.1 heat-shock protein Hsp90 [Succiniclasticum sp.]